MLLGLISYKGYNNKVEKAIYIKLKHCLSQLAFFIIIFFTLSAKGEQLVYESNYDFNIFRESLPFVDLENDTRINLLLLISIDKNLDVINSTQNIHLTKRLDNNFILKPKLLTENKAHALFNDYDLHLSAYHQISERIEFYDELVRQIFQDSDITPSEKILISYLVPIFYLNKCTNFQNTLAQTSHSKVMTEYSNLLIAINYFRCSNYTPAYEKFKFIETGNQLVDEYSSYMSARSANKSLEMSLFNQKNIRSKLSYYPLADKLLGIQSHFLNLIRSQFILLDSIEHYSNTYPEGQFQMHILNYKLSYNRLLRNNFLSSLSNLNVQYQKVETYENALDWVGRVNADYLAFNQYHILETLPELNAANTLRMIRDYKKHVKNSTFERELIVTRVMQTVDILKQQDKTDLANLVDITAFWALEGNAYKVIDAIDKLDLSIDEKSDFINFSLWVLKADAYEKINLFQESQLLWERLLKNELTPAQSFYAQVRLVDSVLAQKKNRIEDLNFILKTASVTIPEIRQTLLRALDNQTLMTYAFLTGIVNQDKAELERIYIALIDNNLAQRNWEFLRANQALLSQSAHWSTPLEERLHLLNRWLILQIEDNTNPNPLYFYTGCGTLGGMIDKLILSQGQNPKALFCSLGYLMTSDSLQSKVLVKKKSFRYVNNLSFTPINSLLLEIFNNVNSSESEKKLALSTLIYCNSDGYKRYEYKGRCESHAIDKKTRQSWIDFYEQYFGERIY
ncbi:hypothetical protein SAMN02583745_02162 [Thorsellia anophelis DSM 18579]|uniref:Uncharacterized protein n=1 Tax=Thorsellia anophelis DSM 18579 TaxID=1123402 RepID=A0A1I0DWS9_9GAMM|nr:hypothetical protein SAMN02583745_02162 [Thorsellia anophelis DSM 18579]